MMKLNFIVLLFFLTNGWMTAKDLPKYYDLPVTLSKSDQKKMEQANELIAEATELWKTLNMNYNPDSVSDFRRDSICNADAYPILVKAAKKFEEANALKFEVYHENCNKFFEAHRFDSPSGIENAKRFQKEAANYYEKAKTNRRSASYYVNEYSKAFGRYFEAISLEIIAVKKEGRALQIYQDWPVHYAYEWDDDIEVDLFNPKSTVAFKKPVIKPAEKHDTVLVVQEVPDSTIIFYQIQIAAHTVKITPKYIKDNVYNGNLPVQEIVEDGWYKYTIGRYKTFEEANKLLRSLNVAKAFVVAYKNGRRVPLKDIDESQTSSYNTPN